MGIVAEHPHFLTYATQLAALLRHAILVDQVVYPFAFRSDIEELLEDHITSNIVKVRPNHRSRKVNTVVSIRLMEFK
jgi:hypothetical protein